MDFRIHHLMPFQLMFLSAVLIRKNGQYISPSHTSKNGAEMGQATHPQTTAKRFSFRKSLAGNAVETGVRAANRFVQPHSVPECNGSIAEPQNSP